MPVTAEQGEVLLSGYRAMRVLEKHISLRAGFPKLEKNACKECLSYAATVMMTDEDPREAVDLRCEETREAQKQLWAAADLAKEIDGTA